MTQEERNRALSQQRVKGFVPFGSKEAHRASNSMLGFDPLDLSARSLADYALQQQHGLDIVGQEHYKNKDSYTRYLPIEDRKPDLKDLAGLDWQVAKNEAEWTTPEKPYIHLEGSEAAKPEPKTREERRYGWRRKRQDQEGNQ